ncbi:SseB family protein [Micromonospora peucetia]|uniref:SseB family protein n=1 Tax=Micromonospora peucetia TaxID=47871 RepID=UPI00331CEF44
MTEWEPATDAEAAMRDALRANDQQLYFRVLARTELLLPISAEALAGTASVGWGTWSTGGRTHVLAFTSSSAVRACLGENGSAVRRTAYTDLADGWPNHEWWLAVNPGLPIEGYLPAWFVAQLSRGDVRLPGRTMGARARLERVETAARARAQAAGQDPPGGPDTGPTTGMARFDGTLRPESTAVSSTGRASASTRPGLPAESSRTPLFPADQPDPWSGAPTAGGLAGFDAVSAPDRLPPPRSAPLTERPRGLPTPAAQPSPSTNGHPAGEAPERPNRSFFEPASGRAAANRQEALRSGERAAPPPRLPPGSQPFPRRRPLVEPAPQEPTHPTPGAPTGGEPTQAFTPTGEEATRAFGVSDGEPTRAFAVPGAEATQVLPPRGSDEDATRDLRAPEPGPPPAYGGRRPEPPADATQALPLRRPTPEPVGPEPVLDASGAEPVSGPPAPRRGFTPIVIEGTVIESRDLVGPPAAELDLAADETVSLFEPVRRRRESVAASAGPPGVAPTPTAPGVTPGHPSAPVDPTWPGEPAAPGEVPTPADPAWAVAPASVAVPGSAPTPDGAAGEETAPAATASTDAGVPVVEPVVLAEEYGSVADEPMTEAETGRVVGDVSPDAGLAGFQPANEVEENLLDAAGAGSTDTFLSTLLLARVLLPVAAESAPGSRPGEPGFVWRTEELDGETFVVVHTSPERLADHTDATVETIEVRFVQLIRCWPDECWSFAVNPGTPVGAKLPGEQIVGLANWAAEVGLGDDAGTETEPPAAEEPVSRPRYDPPAPDPARPTVMQKAVAPSQLAYYLERGYDRVSGFVHRAGELAHLTSPAELHDALGLGYPDSPFARDAGDIYVLRWPAHRPSLYRIPYGGQNEAAMRAMEGWVIERPPFRGNGFAPGESSDVVAEFKVDSARLPHGAQLWRIGADGTERVVAILDTDALRWRQVGEQ